MAMVEMREKVVRFRHELVNTESGEVCSVSEFTTVCLNPETRRPQPFPSDVALLAETLRLPAES